jgi:putative N6-adenine-specific DNA methylase
MKMTGYNFQLFAICLPGLESVLCQELMHLGIPEKSMNTENGGIGFDGDWNTLINCNLFLRTAHRILVRIGSFYAAGFPELKRKIGRIAWKDFLKPGIPVSVHVTSRKSRLYHSDAVEQRICEVLTEEFNMECVQNKTDSSHQVLQEIYIRLFHDLCTVSLDSSGEHLHFRGYRQALTRATLRETLAAAMILYSGWKEDYPFLDPFCGSGTLPIEAAMMAMKIPPGSKRIFSFMSWPEYEISLFHAACQRESSDQHGPCPAIGGSDRDAGSIKIAHENAKRAGVEGIISLKQASISEIITEEPEGWIVTNPPYGHRLHDHKDLRNLYSSFGRVLRERFSGWHVTMLCSDPELIHAADLNLEPGPCIQNGGIHVRMYKG